MLFSRLVDINIPMLVALEDYHEIDSIVDNLNMFISSKQLKAKYKELGFENGLYIFVIYIMKGDLDDMLREISVRGGLKRMKMLSK